MLHRFDALRAEIPWLSATPNVDTQCSRSLVLLATGIASYSRKCTVKSAPNVPCGNAWPMQGLLHRGRQDDPLSLDYAPGAQ